MNINSLHRFQLKNKLEDIENVSEYSPESGNDGIAGLSESDLESGYLNESCQGMKLGPYQ